MKPHINIIVVPPGSVLEGAECSICGEKEDLLIGRRIDGFVFGNVFPDPVCSECLKTLYEKLKEVYDENPNSDERRSEYDLVRDSKARA